MPSTCRKRGLSRAIVTFVSTCADPRHTGLDRLRVLVVLERVFGCVDGLRQPYGVFGLDPLDCLVRSVAGIGSLYRLGLGADFCPNLAIGLATRLVSRWHAFNIGLGRIFYKHAIRNSRPNLASGTRARSDLISVVNICRKVALEASNVGLGSSFVQTWFRKLISVHS